MEPLVKNISRVFICLMIFQSQAFAAEKWSTDKLTEWKELSEDCKNSTDPAAHKIICEKVEKIATDLKEKGYCLGPVGPNEEAASWRRCDKLK